MVPPLLAWYRSPVAGYSAGGHPSIEPITDAAMLHGDFWPEEETVEDFLAALHEWRGHKRTDPAA